MCTLPFVVVVLRLVRLTTISGCISETGNARISWPLTASDLGVLLLAETTLYFLLFFRGFGQPVVKPRGSLIGGVLGQFQCWNIPS